MDDFERQNAAEWQPVDRRKKKKPQSSRAESSSSRPSNTQAKHRTYTPAARAAPAARIAPAARTAAAAFSAPTPHQPSPIEDSLINLEPSENHSTRKPVVDSSNPFALLGGDSSSSANSTPIHRRTGLLDEPVIPAMAVYPGSRAASGMNAMSTTSSSLNDLLDLDSSFFLTPPSEGFSSQLVSPQNDNLVCLLDDDVPPMAREEDDAWFDAQSKSTRPTAIQPRSTTMSDAHLKGPAQLIYPIGTPVVPSYRSHGSPRGRGNHHGRGGLRARGGSNHASSHPHASSGSEDSSVRTQLTKRGRGYGPRSHRGRVTLRQSGPRPVSENMPFAQANTGMHTPSAGEPAISTLRHIEHSHASTDHLEEQSLVSLVANAIESDQQIQSLATHQDTSATTEWRKRGMRPGKAIALPKLNLAGHFDTKSSSKAAIARPAEIGIITNTHIDQVWGAKYNSAKLLIYGTAEAVDEAAKLVFEWLAEIRKLQDKWAKVWAYNDRCARRLRKCLLRDQARSKYRQNRSGDEVLAYSAQIVWPLPKEPEQILGMNFEALDPIRMDYECYITCERGSQTVFTVQGNNEEGLQEALERMRCLPAEWSAKTFDAESFVILDIPYTSDLDTLPPVCKVPYSFPRPLFGQSTSKNDGVGFQFKHPIQQHQSIYPVPEDSPAGKLLDAVAETTQHARYFRNLLKLRLHLGTFAARKTQRPDLDNDTYSFSSFSEMIEDHNKMDARVSMEIGDPIIEEHVLQRCFGASHILVPQDAWTNKLSEVQPIHCATFEIANPGGQAGDLILDVELSAEDGATTIVSKHWYQLAKGRSEPRKLLDCSIIDLQNGSLAWHLGLEEFVSVDEHGLSPDYQVFPDTLSVDAEVANNPSAGHDFVIYRTRQDRLVKVPIKSVRQKRCWRFNTVADRGEWVVEVSHVGKTLIGTEGQQTPFQPRWTFNIHHNGWDGLLANNSCADIGKMASWGHGDASTLLFPMPCHNSIPTGVARQDDDDSSSDGSDCEDNDNSTAPEEPGEAPGEPASLKNFEQLMDLLRGLADVVVGRPRSSPAYH